MNETSKKQLIVVAVAVPVFLAVVAGGIAFGRRVGRADQHNQAAHGTVRVRLANGWSALEREALDEELRRLDRLGPKFEWAPSSANDPPSPPGPGVFLRTVVVYRGDWGPEGCAAHGAGYYDTQAFTVWVDPVCAPGEALQATFGHEVGHALGMGHVCRSAGDTRDFRCSPVGFDRASIMNPSLTTDAFGAGDALPGGTVPPLDPSPLDLAEFLRVMRPPAARPDAGPVSP